VPKQTVFIIMNLLICNTMQDTTLDGITQEISAKKITFADFAADARNQSAKLERRKDGKFQTKGFTETIFNDTRIVENRCGYLDGFER
jgi:uncharacterized lipoprotein YehR (DUF1307 family)